MWITLLTAPAAAQRVRCATPPRDANAPAGDSPTDCGYHSTNPLSRYAPGTIYRIPVVFHVITTTTGTGALTRPWLQSQIDVLNEDFRALPGTPGAAGVDARIEFHLATTDPSGQPTSGFTTTANNIWYLDRQVSSYTAALAWDPHRYLNVYTNSGGGALGYVPDVPQGGIVGNTLDRVVVAWDTVGRNAPMAPYNLGRTLTHEVGHYLGLFHTFNGGCGSASACNTSGDLICDTAADSQPRYGCPLGASSCGGTAPVRNYMTYSDDLCMNHFTAEQVRRMRCTLEHWRPLLGAPCPQATATVRTVTGNPPSYLATAPHLGSPWTGTVLPQQTGHSLAALVGYLNPAQQPLPNGYTLLVDINDPAGPVLSFGFQPGPIAVFALQIPNDPQLCGLRIATQAAHFGGAPDYALSNAIDLVVGI